MQKNYPKFIASLLVCVFTFQSIVVADAVQNSYPPANMPSGYQTAWNLSESIARVDDVYKASEEAPLIILFSDAHTNVSAQMNLAEAMRHVMSREKINWVFTEAAVADNSIHFLRQLASDSKEVETVAKRYLYKTKINGVEYLNLTSEDDFKIWGVEDKTLYLKSLHTYSENIKQREILKRKLSEAENLFRILETRVLNPEMHDLYTSRSAYLKDELPAVDYLLKLSALKQRYIPSASERISVIQKLAEIKQIENGLNFEKAQNELSELIEKENSDSGIQPVKRISFKQITGTSSMKEFLMQNRESLEGKEELKKYVEYIRQFESIDLNDFEKERAETEDNLFTRMSKTREDIEFVRYADALTRLEKLSELKLNADDYQKIKSNPDLHNYERIIAFLNGMLLQCKLSGEKVLFSDGVIQNSLNQSAEFYELTSERDRIFYKKIREKMRSENIQKACLVTGGYHADHLKKILRLSGISYVSILPAVSHETDFVRYERMLLSQTASSDYRQYAALGKEVQKRSTLMTLYAARKEFDSPDVLYELAREFGGSKDWVDRQLLSASRLSSGDSESEDGRFAESAAEQLTKIIRNMTGSVRITRQLESDEINLNLLGDELADYLGWYRDLSPQLRARFIDAVSDLYNAASALQASDEEGSAAITPDQIESAYRSISSAVSFLTEVIRYIEKQYEEMPVGIQAALTNWLNDLYHIGDELLYILGEPSAFNLSALPMRADESESHAAIFRNVGIYLRQLGQEMDLGQTLEDFYLWKTVAVVHGGESDFYETQRMMFEFDIQDLNPESGESQTVFRNLMTALRTLDDNFDDPDAGARLAVPSELSSNEATQNLLMETFNQTEESLDKYLKQGSVDLFRRTTLYLLDQFQVDWNDEKQESVKSKLLDSARLIAQRGEIAFNRTQQILPYYSNDLGIDFTALSDAKKKPLLTAVYGTSRSSEVFTRFQEILTIIQEKFAVDITQIDDAEKQRIITASFYLAQAKEDPKKGFKSGKAYLEEFIESIGTYFGITPLDLAKPYQKDDPNNLSLQDKIRLITSGYNVAFGKDKGLETFNSFIAGLDDQFGIKKEDLQKRHAPNENDPNSLSLQDKIRLITSGYAVSLGKDKGLETFNSFIAGLDDQFGIKKEDLQKRHDPNESDPNSLSLQDKIRLITSGYHVALGKDKGLETFNSFIAGLDDQFGIKKEDLQKRHDPNESDPNSLSLQDKIRLITSGYHVALGKDKGLETFNHIVKSIIESGYAFSDIPNIQQKTLTLVYIYHSLSYVLNWKMNVEELLNKTHSYTPGSSDKHHPALKKAHYFNIQVRLEYRRIKQHSGQDSGARLTQESDAESTYPVKLTQADENGNKWVAETIKGGKMRYSISRARQGMSWGLRFQAIRLGRQLPSIADVWILREQDKFGRVMLIASKWVQRVFDHTIGFVLDILFFTASPFWTDYTDAVTVFLTDGDTGRLTGYYVYYPKDNLSSLVVVDPLNRGTGAVDILFEDMKRRIAKNDPDFKIHAKIYRASERVPLSKIGDFFGTIDERKKALGIRSSVTFIPYSDPDQVITPVTEPLKYSTKSLPMRYPQLYDLITEYLYQVPSEESVDVLMMGAGLDERYLEAYPSSPQTVEVIASLADRKANLTIIDVNETVHSIIGEPKYYLWYKTFEGSRKLRNEYRDSTSYDLMRHNLAGVLKDAGPDDFKWDAGTTKEKVYRVDLSGVQDVHIETVLSEFSAVDDYGIESQNIIISTIALAYDLMRMNMDQRNQFMAKLARALKPGGVMIVHADEFVLMHPDLSEYPFHLRSDQVIKIGFSDVQKMLKKMTGSDYQLQLYGPLVEIKKTLPSKKAPQSGSRLAQKKMPDGSDLKLKIRQSRKYVRYIQKLVLDHPNASEGQINELLKDKYGDAEIEYISSGHDSIVVRHKQYPKYVLKYPAGLRNGMDWHQILLSKFILSGLIKKTHGDETKVYQRDGFTFFEIPRHLPFALDQGVYIQPFVAGIGNVPEGSVGNFIRYMKQAQGAVGDPSFENFVKYKGKTVAIDAGTVYAPEMAWKIYSADVRSADSVMTDEALLKALKKITGSEQWSERALTDPSESNKRTIAAFYHAIHILKYSYPESARFAMEYFRSGSEIRKQKAKSQNTDQPENASARLSSELFPKNISELGYEALRKGSDVLDGLPGAPFFTADDQFEESELVLLFTDFGDLEYLRRGGERFVFKYTPIPDFVVKVPRVRGKLTAYYDFFKYQAIAALTKFSGNGTAEIIDAAGEQFYKIPQLAPFAFSDGVFIEPYLDEKPEEYEPSREGLIEYYKNMGINFYDNGLKNFVIYRGQPVVYDIGALRIQNAGWKKLHENFTVNGKEYPSEARIKEIVMYLSGYGEEGVESIMHHPDILLGAVMYDALSKKMTVQQAFETTVLYSRKIPNLAARLASGDSDHKLGHPSDYSQETLGQFVSERIGSGNVIDIGGDGNFIRLTASALASEGVQLNEIYSMDIASLKKISPSDTDGAFEAQTLLGQDHPLKRLKEEPVAQALEEQFSLMFMNAPVLEGASLGKGGFRDWVYDAKFFGAEDAVLLVRLHTDDISNSRIVRFVSVLNGSSQESVNPVKPSYGPVADMLGIVPFEGRNYQLTDFHTHMPQKMLTTPYTSNSPVPIIEFKRTDTMTDGQKKALAGKILGIVLQTKNTQIRAIGLSLLVTLRNYAEDLVVAETDRLRKVYNRAVLEPYTDSVRADIQVLFEHYGLSVSGGRLADLEEMLIDPSDTEARSAWKFKSEAASKLGPFSLSALAAKKLDVSDRFYEVLTNAGLISQGKRELSSIASLITNPYELDAWLHLLDAGIQNPDNFYESIEPYFLNDASRQNGDWISVDAQTHRFSGTKYSVFSVNQMWSDEVLPLSSKILMTLTLLGTEETRGRYTFNREALQLAKNISLSEPDEIRAVKAQTEFLAAELHQYIRAFVMNRTAPYTEALALYHGTPYPSETETAEFKRQDTVYLTPLKDEAAEYASAGTVYKLRIPIDSIADVSGWGTPEWEFIAESNFGGRGYSVLNAENSSGQGSRLAEDAQNLNNQIESVQRKIRLFRYLGVSRFMTLWRKIHSDEEKKLIFRRAMNLKFQHNRDWSYGQTYEWEKVHITKLKRNTLIAVGIGISAFWITSAAYALIPLGVNSVFLHIYPVLMQRYIRMRIELINLKEQLKQAKPHDSGSRLSEDAIADLVFSDPYNSSTALKVISSWARGRKLYIFRENPSYFGDPVDERTRENLFTITAPVFHYAFYRMRESNLASLPLEYSYEDNEFGPRITLTLSSYDRENILFRTADTALKNLSGTFGFEVTGSPADDGFRFEIQIPSQKIFNYRSSRSSLNSLNVQTGMYPLILEIKKYLTEIRSGIDFSARSMGLISDFIYSGPEELLTRQRYSESSLESVKFILRELYINALNPSAEPDIRVLQDNNNWIIEIENPGRVNFDALYELAEHYARNNQFRKYRNKSGYLVPPDPTSRYETEYYSGQSEVMPAEQALEILKKMKEENPSDVLWVEYLSLKSLTAEKVLPESSLRGKQIGGAGRGILNAFREIRKIFRGGITVENSDSSVIVKVMIPSGIESNTKTDVNFAGARLASRIPEQTPDPVLRKIKPAADRITREKTEYKLPLLFNKESERIGGFLAEAGFQKRSEIRQGLIREFPIQVEASLLRIRFLGLSEAEIYDFNSGSAVATLNIFARKNLAADAGYQRPVTEEGSDSEYTVVDDAVSIDMQTAVQIAQMMSEYGVSLNPVNFILNTDHYLGMFDADQREVISRNLMRLFSEMKRRNLASFSFEGKSAAEYGFKDFSPFENAPSVYFWNLNKFDSVDADTRINLPYFEQPNGMIPVYTTVTAASAIANLKQAGQIPPGILDELNEIFRKLTRSDAVLNQDTLKVLWEYDRDAGQDVYKLLSVKPFSFRGLIDASVYLQKLIRHYVDTSA